MWNSHETPRGTVQSHPACKTAEIIGRRCVYIHLVWNQDILQEEITKKVKLKESVFKGIFQHLQKYAHSLSRRELVTRQLHIQTVPSLPLSLYLLLVLSFHHWPSRDLSSSPPAVVTSFRYLDLEIQPLLFLNFLSLVCNVVLVALSLCVFVSFVLPVNEELQFCLSSLSLH